MDPNEIYYLCVYNDPKIKIFDRKTKKVLKELMNPANRSDFNTLQPLIGYHIKDFPYLICKEARSLSLINTNTMEISKIMDLIYDNLCCFKQCLIQEQDGKNLKIINLGRDTPGTNRKIMEITYYDVYKWDR